MFGWSLVFGLWASGVVARWQSLLCGTHTGRAGAFCFQGPGGDGFLLSGRHRELLRLSFFHCRVRCRHLSAIKTAETESDSLISELDGAVSLYSASSSSSSIFFPYFLFVGGEEGCYCYMSDTPGDPGSQLPYQEFSPYYLAPI